MLELPESFVARCALTEALSTVQEVTVNQVLTWIGESAMIVLLGSMAHTWWVEQRGTKQMRGGARERGITSTHQSISGRMESIDEADEGCKLILVDAMEIVAACALPSPDFGPTGLRGEFEEVVYVSHPRLQILLPFGEESSDTLDEWNELGGDLRVEIVRHGDQTVFVGIADQRGKGLQHIHRKYFEVHGPRSVVGWRLF